MRPTWLSAMIAKWNAHIKWHEYWMLRTSKGVPLFVVLPEAARQPASQGWKQHSGPDG